MRDDPVPSFGGPPSPEIATGSGTIQDQKAAICRGKAWQESAIGCGSRLPRPCNPLKTKTIPTGTAAKSDDPDLRNKISTLGPLCSVLRRVCAFYRPKWATPPCHLRSSCQVFQRPRSNLCLLAAASVLTFGVLAGPIYADEWKPVASQANWVSTGTFVREFSVPVTTKARPLTSTLDLPRSSQHRAWRISLDRLRRNSRLDSMGCP